MSSTSTPTADDLRASLLAALAAVGHPATFDANGKRLSFDADGAGVDVKCERASLNSYGRATPASITFGRDSNYRSCFRPRSGLFNWPLVAQAAVSTAAALRADREREAEKSSAATVVRRQAGAINASLGLASGAAIRASEENGRLVLTMRDREATEEQIRAMVAAALACGLLPAAGGE